MRHEPAPVVRFEAVGLDKAGAPVLEGIDWTVRAGERWVLVGPNGSGKTSTVMLAAAYDHPTRGVVRVLGHRLGRVDVRALRLRIGLVSASIGKLLRPGVRAADVVMTARFGALEPWWHQYGEDDRLRARKLLDDGGFGYLAERPFGVLSEGERQQVQLARALMNDPELVLLDEPAAGLDVGGRERLVRRLAQLADDPSTPPMLFVTHHVEEIPPGFTHALVLRAGRAVGQGSLPDTLTSATMSEAFGLALRVEQEGGRFTCRAT
ncbi:MAG: iron complex transport system ATP-binding protein [Acidimicrobiaceae bacterium]|jgi:iron complex transport system ATP-binding protein|nr:iron complex transport system ATP-binding protein [Acidimicrobiaceae bacterium]